MKNSEIQPQITSRLFKLLIWSIQIGILVEISNLAADKKIRKIIREESSGFCRCCGKFIGEQNILVAHLNHLKNSGYYNHRDNLEPRCLACEAEYHLQYAENPFPTIGLSKKNNDATTQGHLLKLLKESPELARNLAKKYEVILKRLLDRIDNGHHIEDFL